MQSNNSLATIDPPRRESPARMEVVPLHPSQTEAKIRSAATDRLRSHNEV